MKQKKMRGLLAAVLVLLLLAAMPVSVFAEDYTLKVGVEASLPFSLMANDTSEFTLHGGVPGMYLTQLRGAMVLEGTPTTAGTYFVMLQEITEDAVERTSGFSVLVEAADQPENQPTEPAVSSPKVTKHPTGEQVVEGESAIFIARGENVRQYVWELLDTDGTTLPCSEISGKYPGVSATGYDTEKLTLSKISLALNGCKVRCRFVDAEESFYSDYATITVLAGDVVPEITKHPTGEHVQEGGMCQFVARADNATSLKWMIATPDERAYYDCSELSDVFPGIRVDGTSSECLTLYSIPYDMDGWSVYCVFTGPGGKVSSDMASIRVNPLPTEPPTTEPPTETTAPPTEAPTSAPTEPPTQASTEPATEPIVQTEDASNIQKPQVPANKSNRGFVLVLAAIIGVTIIAVCAIATYLILRLRNRDEDDEYEYEDEYEDGE